MLFTVNIKSRYMGGYNDLSILLPNSDESMTCDEFYKSGKKYKVLWLLHGGLCDYNDWIHKTKIELYAREHDFIVVMPSVRNTFYTRVDVSKSGINVPLDSYSYIKDELMPFVHGWLPASSDPKDNYVAGLSMGSMGTLKFIANNPELFAGAAALSGFPEALDDPDGQMHGELMTLHGDESLIEECGDNVWDLIVQNKDKLPPIYACCGTDDFVYPQYLKFKKHAEENGLNIIFSETEGYGHEYRFWDIEIEKAFYFFETGVPQQKPAGPKMEIG